MNRLGESMVVASAGVSVSGPLLNIRKIKFSYNMN